MIHVVSSANQHLYARQLDQMFRMRHSFYVEGHGWKDLVSHDGREADEFDDLEAVYLLSLDPWGEVAASVRLNPTSGPTLLKKFSAWASEALPEGEDVWDISRWIAAPQHRRGEKSRWSTNYQRELMIGILEFCESRGLSRLTMLAEHRLAERMGSYGWPVRFLGEPREYEGGKGVAVAAEITVGPETMALTRQKTGVLGRMLFEIDPARTPTIAAPAPEPSEHVRAIAGEIGVERMRRLIRAIAAEIAGADMEDRPRVIELVGALNRILEACAAGLEDMDDVQNVLQGPLEMQVQEASRRLS